MNRTPVRQAWRRSCARPPAPSSASAAHFSRWRSRKISSTRRSSSPNPVQFHRLRCSCAFWKCSRAWLAARSDPPHYGKLLLFDFPKGKLVFGPRQIEARIDQDAFISQQISLWSQAGSQVIRGSPLAIPVEESLLYVQPLYLAAERGRLPELKRVITAFGNRIAMEETLEASLQQLFGGRAAQPDVAPRTAAARAEPAQRLASQALEHFQKAQEHLRLWNWTGFGEELRRVEEILRDLQREK